MTQRSRTSLYDAADALLAGRDRRKTDHHTYLERRMDGAGYPAHIALRFHATDVLRFIPDTADAAGYVELDTDGWHTTTTWDRMSMFGLRLGSNGKAGIVVYPVGAGYDCGGFPYYDRLRLTADGTALCDEQPALRPFMGPVLTRSGWTGMTLGESSAQRSRMYDALRTETIPGIGTADVYEMSQADISACPYVIFTPQHYRADGTCRCDDPTHSEMKKWGYSWNDADGRWN